MDPSMLIALAGAAKGGGGSTKVSQSSSNSSQSALSLSISNLIGGGTTGPVGSSTPLTSAPVANATQTPDPSPSPSYGAYPDTSFNTALPATNSGAGGDIFSNKLVLIAGAGLVFVMIAAALKRKR